MKIYQVSDKSIVVILSKKQAMALYHRTQQHTEVRKSMMLERAEGKLLRAIQAELNNEELMKFRNTVIRLR